MHKYGYNPDVLYGNLQNFLEKNQLFDLNTNNNVNSNGVDASSNNNNYHHENPNASLETDIELDRIKLEDELDGLDPLNLYTANGTTSSGSLIHSLGANACLPKSAVMAVLTGPGINSLTLMRCSCSSIARTWVSFHKASLDAE